VNHSATSIKPNKMTDSNKSGELTQYEYFEKRGIVAQYRDLQSETSLDAYELVRRDLFTDKLFLPPYAFKESQLLEIGPSAGENALIFARWGASCTLVEPNQLTHPYIKKYFEQFKLSEKLVELSGLTLEDYSKRPLPSEKFDFIVAEGLIYLVKPDSLWINFFDKIVKKNGFVILSYCETFGNFMELFLKATHYRLRSLTGMDSVEVAKKWFGAKWDSIPHTTKIESWVADPLESPTARLSHFYELKSFCRMMNDAGFYLYSSWPSYKDSSAVHWIKKKLTPEEQLRSQEKFIAQSRLSHMFGRKLLLKQPDPALEESMSNLLTLTDSLIDEFNNDKATQCIQYLTSLGKVIGSDAVFAEEQDITDTLNTIKSLKKILDLLIAGNADDIIAFCSTDQAFIKSWGMPTHYAIYRKG